MPKKYLMWNVVFFCSYNFPHFLFLFSGGTQEQLIKANKLDDKVPDTEIETKISVQGKN